VDGHDGYSGFSLRDPISGDTHRTELEHMLRERGVERLVIGGLATDYCVRATAFDAIELGFEVVVLEDAIAAVDLESGDGDRAVDEMREAGVVLTATES
jgi:nicotinamidase-related amidase